jgi:hypothetical protein
MEEVAGDGGGDLGMEAGAGLDGGVDLCESRSNDSCEIKEVALQLPVVQKSLCFVT